MKQTVNNHLVKSLGIKRALMVETLVMLWSLYRATNEGEDPRNIETLSNEIGKSHATVYRWLADFREAFPQWSDPGDLLDALDVRDRPVTVREVAALVIA